jgi:ABC-type sugar transport system permease subunit
VAGLIIASFYFSLTSYDVVNPPSFLGLQTYLELTSDDLFWQSLVRSTGPRDAASSQQGVMR